MKRLQLAAVYLGGFIGPFGGQSLAAILPEFADSFGITLDQAAATMTVYIFPFATTMLFSARLVRSFPPHRVVLTAYAVTLVTSGVLLLTPWWGLFLIAFAIAGIANAFTTPVLQIILKSLTPPEKLGSALGTYAAMQSLGLLSGPLLSGIASLVNWRLVFVVIAISALFILVIQLPSVPPPSTSDEISSERVRWISILIHMASSFVVGIGIIGLGFLTALHVESRFDLGPVGRGMVVMCGGAAAFLASRKLGTAADQYGAGTVLLASVAIGAIALLLLPAVPTVWLTALMWAMAVLAAQGVQMTVNLLVINGPKGSSLISTVQAFRFYGSALAPIVFLPIYQVHSGAAFWIPALALVGVLLAQMARCCYK